MRKQHINKLQAFITAAYVAGSTDTPEQLKKQYWRKYKAQWRKRKREEQKEFTLSFTKPELAIITNQAKKHSRSRTQYIKEAALAYSSDKFLVPDEHTILRIKELLCAHYTVIQQLEEDERISKQLGDRLKETIESLEERVLFQLQHPEVPQSLP